ncbi:D-alanyl-D-alanine carboxypeptidase [Patescibacteria group bacterium]|nr:D-alanyl-D-alanine carboxypeptidase [Patescibacteria group bacterium]
MEKTQNDQLKRRDRGELSYIRVVIFFSILGLIVTSLLIFTKETTTPARPSPPKNSENPPIILKKNPFDDLNLEARAAIVWDINKQKSLYEYNSEAQLPLASLTKLMTVLVASELLPDEYIITVEEDSLLEEGDSGLFAHEKWNLSDMLDFILVVSSNDGANVIASIAGAARMQMSPQSDDSPEATFVRAMNSKSTNINLSQTYFINETGLDPNSRMSGGYGSVKDVALLMEYILKEHPTLVSATVYKTLDITSLSGITHTATNTNKIIGSIPGLIASKTGFTDLAGGNLIVAYNAGLNRPLIAVVLSSTQEGRFSDIVQLVEASLLSLSE